MSDAGSGVPLGCSLAGAALDERAAQWRDVLGAALIDRQPIRQGLRLRLHRNRAIERRLGELIESERACCPGVTFRIVAAGDELTLEVAGSPEAAPSIRRAFGASARREGHDAG